jgi:hypothetical protein
MMPTCAERANPYHRANSLAELLSWHDADFVRCAYVTVLGRQPDREGEKFYLQRLRSGRPKLEVLRHLRASPEAAGHDPGIAGFDRSLRRARLQALPGIGWIFRLVWRPLDSVSPDERGYRATMNAIAANRSAIDAITERVEAAPVTHLPSAEVPLVRPELKHSPETSAARMISPDPHLSHLSADSPLARFFARKTC